MKRERFGSRIGFILVSAGCAIGIGNVWKFPYICGEYGGAAFILIYLAFLLILGIPVLACEFAIGRSSRKSVALSFEELAPPGTRWHRLKYIGIIGCYLLMMFYVSNNLLPLGSLGYVLFCTRKNGWGWESFMAEANAGEGLRFPTGLKSYVAYGIPLIIALIYLKGYYDKFQTASLPVLAGWMAAAVLFLLFVFWCALGKGRDRA